MGEVALRHLSEISLYSLNHSLNSTQQGNLKSALGTADVLATGGCTPIAFPLMSHCGRPLVVPLSMPPYALCAMQKSQCDGENNIFISSRNNKQHQAGRPAPLPSLCVEEKGIHEYRRKLHFQQPKARNTLKSIFS